MWAFCDAVSAGTLPNEPQETHFFAVTEYLSAR
jgi:hypothetical protein